MNTKKTLIIHASEDDLPSVEDIQHVDPNVVLRNEHSVDSKRDNLISDNIRSMENNEVQNDTNDKTHEDDSKEMHKKDKSKISDVRAYLRSEFSGHNAQGIEIKYDGTVKLPNYGEIDMMGYSRKYINKKRKIPKSYSRDTVMVQFMGSEKMPESRALMTYEPESRNYTVKGMFVMLMITHFFTFSFITTLFISPARPGMIFWGHYICIPCLCLYFTVVIITACFHICRQACCTCTASFFACFFLSGFYGALGGYIGKRIFIFNTFASWVSDIFVIFLACGTFNFTGKGAYLITIFTTLVGLIICMPSMEFYAQHNVYYWADDKFPQENWLSYLLTIVFSCITAVFQTAQLKLLLEGEWVEVGEDDYSFGAYLLFVSLLDFPIRFMRKKGWLASCDTGGGDDDDEE